MVLKCKTPPLLRHKSLSFLTLLTAQLSEGPPQTAQLSEESSIYNHGTWLELQYWECLTIACQTSPKKSTEHAKTIPKSQWLFKTEIDPSPPKIPKIHFPPQDPNFRYTTPTVTRDQVTRLQSSRQQLPHRRGVLTVGCGNKKPMGCKSCKSQSKPVSP